MGPPVFAAALTTAATGAVMYGCTILFFLRFGAPQRAPPSPPP